MKKKFRAFTIAEIVIAMVVLSSIAMILMPVLIKDTNKQTTDTALEKTYSLLQQTARSVGLLTTRGKLSYNSVAVYTLFEALEATTKAKKGTDRKSEGYFDDYTTDLPVNFVANGDNTLILGNGVFVMYMNELSPGIGPYIVLVVNGKRTPNKVGKDIFFFSAEYDKYINNNIAVYPALQPSRCDDEEICDLCNMQSTDIKDRVGCARKILSEK